ncbi:MAG: VCBS repeat-containing protein [Gemmataceae bacterium]|nr:VCBS repeat-containing protein [Gemmataceae bacterium]
MGWDSPSARLPMLLLLLAAPLSFDMKEIDTKLGVGYAVLIADVDGDKKPDIIVADTDRVVWYQNPTWKKRTIIQGKTKRDNVCIAAHDIDGDGRLDLALGADWRVPFDTSKGGTLQWLRQPKDPDKEWDVFPIGEEPTMHRIRWADLRGDGTMSLVSGPLMGRDSTAKGNWEDGRPLRLQAWAIPKDPTKPWKAETLDESLRVMHNFAAVPSSSGKGSDLLTASCLGVHRLSLADGKWRLKHVGTGDQSKPKGRRGASEIKQGRLKDGSAFIATIEPWHGDSVVVYTPDKAGGLWTRAVIDDKLRWGHAVWCADLDGDGEDEVVIGVRDNLSREDRGGVRIYKRDGDGWARQLLDAGGVAVEDLAVADLDGDGKPDIVAVGRATKNVRIYRNTGKK